MRVQLALTMLMLASSGCMISTLPKGAATIEEAQAALDAQRKSVPKKIVLQQPNRGAAAERVWIQADRNNKQIDPRCTADGSGKNVVVYQGKTLHCTPK